MIKHKNDHLLEFPISINNKRGVSQRERRVFLSSKLTEQIINLAQTLCTARELAGVRKPISP